jgi:hypothetical protein
MELILSSGHNFSEYQCYATKINKGRWVGKDRIKVEKWNRRKKSNLSAALLHLRRQMPKIVAYALEVFR